MKNHLNGGININKLNKDSTKGILKYMQKIKMVHINHHVHL